MSEHATSNRPAPIFSLAALASPFAIFGLALLVARQLGDDVHQAYNVLSIILVGQVLAVLSAIACAVCGFRRGEHSIWLGIVGVSVSLYILKRLLFASQSPL